MRSPEIKILAVSDQQSAIGPAPGWRRFEQRRDCPLPLTNVRGSDGAPVAHALLRAVSTIVSTLKLPQNLPGVEVGLDAARKSACATATKA